MARRSRRSRQWWEKTVARWRKSKLTAAEFADLEDLHEGTLRWWSTQLKHDTRAKHGSGAGQAVPIEIAVPSEARGDAAAFVEVQVAEVTVRCSADTDVAYVVALVRALQER